MSENKARDLAESHLKGRTGRRKFLRRIGGLGLGAAAASVCGVVAYRAAAPEGDRPARSQAARPRLPVPQLIDGRDGEPVALAIRAGERQFMPGVATPTLGINQDYLGPTIRARRGGELNLRYHNTLAEGVSMHGHGLHVPGNVDGGPQLEIAPGERWRPALSIAQSAATCWYHPHTHGRTGAQVYAGLAGMIIIDDDNAAASALPRSYGVDDLPVIIQDRTFDARGRLVYSLRDAGEDGWLGDTVVINGAIAPHARVPAGKVRLRLLNGANARFYIVAFADNRRFYKIASDGGLLAAPQPLREMEMVPGERCEIVVDMSDGKPAGLLTLFEDQIDEDEDGGAMEDMQNFFAGAEAPPRIPSLTLKVDRALPAHTAPLPEKLASIARPKDGDIVRTRDFLLTMGDHRGHAAMDMAINGAAMDMNVINERVRLGEWERWRIRSNLGEHPFHVHGCSFLVTQQEGEVVPPDRQCWRDTVLVDDDAWSEIVMRFNHPATDQHPYMYHCHILEHEDLGMMGQFTVG